MKEFEFKCNKCGHIETAEDTKLQGKWCPKCTKGEMQRIWSLNITRADKERLR
jgi:Zn finger protein HypA/HybF involved in hydrogenase expression